jgi:hypothetical protein
MYTAYLKNILKIYIIIIIIYHNINICYIIYMYMYIYIYIYIYCEGRLLRNYGSQLPSNCI